MQVEPALGKLAEEVLDSYRQHGLKIATAESCTGGLISAQLTSIAGSSDVFERGFVTYSNEAKTEAIGVPADVVASHGAVSAEVAEAMAEGALCHSHADVAVSVTGIAGPGGGSPQKPVGLVFIATARNAVGARPARQHVFDDRGREYIRNETARTALQLLLAEADKA